MKIAKGIASVLKTIGLVVMAIALVMSIYVVANDGAGWSTLCLLYTSDAADD